MKYLKQFFIILSVTCIGEILHFILPLPVPGSIYGLVLMFILLCLHVIRLEDVRETAIFLIEIMPVMFIPAAVGLLDSGSVLRPVLLPLCVITPLTTIIVMVVSGRIAQAMIRHTGRNDAEKGAQNDE